MKMKLCLNIWREVVALFIFLSCDKSIQTDILLDAEKIVKNKNKIKKLCIALLNEPFRNIFYYRTKSSHRVLNHISQLILPPIKSVEICGGVFGGGLQIVHNHCIIHANVVGNNLKVGPGAIIGKNNDGWPTIGDNVYVAANAVVVGDILIGDNCIIGAGAIVNKDIPANSVYVGNPAHFLRKN